MRRPAAAPSWADSPWRPAPATPRSVATPAAAAVAAAVPFVTPASAAVQPAADVRSAQRAWIGSRTRLHRLYARVNALEVRVVQLLAWVGLWPALLQPPHTAALLDYMDDS